MKVLTMKNRKNDGFSIFEIAAIFVIISLLGVIALAAIREGREWDAYKIEHKCRVVSRVDGQLITTFDGKNVGVGSTSGQTGWLCDDGITYYK